MNQTDTVQKNTESRTIDKSRFVKLSFLQKLGYGVGGFASAFTWSFVSGYLMIFYTDTFGISATRIALLLLVTRILDALNEPAVGFFADRTNSPNGRYRPWLLYGWIPLLVMFIILFWAHPEWNESSKLIYAYITFNLFALAYTIVFMPYMALTSTITQDPGERSSLASMRLTTGIIGTMILAWIVAALEPFFSQKFGASYGYMLTAAVLGVISVPLILIVYRNTKEIVLPPPTQKKLSYWAQIKALRHNRPQILVFLGQFVNGLTVYGRMSVFLYYFKYNAGNPALMATFILFMRIPMILGTITSDFYAKKLKNKARVFTISFICYGVILLINSLMTPSTQPILFWVLVVIASYFHGVGYPQLYAMTPDTVEYAQMVTGARNDGFASSMATLSDQSGMAIGTSLMAYILGDLGYVPNVQQSASVLAGINAMMFIVPGIFSILAGLIFIGYKLDFRKFEEVVQTLQQS